MTTPTAWNMIHTTTQPPRLAQSDDDAPVVPDPAPLASGQARRAWAAASQRHGAS
jgi:hypothetical protein